MPASELPPPLPPETRTVGQLIAETIRFYQGNFWAVLPLGLSLAAVEQVTAGQPTGVQTLVLAAAAPADDGVLRPRVLARRGGALVVDGLRARAS